MSVKTVSQTLRGVGFGVRAQHPGGRSAEKRKLVEATFWWSGSVKDRINTRWVTF